MSNKTRRPARRIEREAIADYVERNSDAERKQTGELDLIRDTIIKHRMHAQTIRNRLGELSMRLFGESPPHGQVADCDVPSSMLARIRDEANELGDVLAGAADILDKLETL